MATVTIARRRDPVIISNERAKQLKQTLLESKEKDTMIDLGNWMGTLSEIKGIEIEEDIHHNHTAIEDIGKIDTHALEEFTRIAPEKKAEMLSEFILNYQKTHQFQRPSIKILEEARDIQLTYYRNNKSAQYVPRSEYEHLLT